MFKGANQVARTAKPHVTCDLFRCFQVIALELERSSSNSVLAGMRFAGGSRLSGGCGDFLRVVLTMHSVVQAAAVAEAAARAAIASATSDAAASAAAGQSAASISSIDDVVLVLVSGIQGRISFAMVTPADASKVQQKDKSGGAGSRSSKDADADGDDVDGGEGGATLLASSDEVADHVVALPTSSRAFCARVFTTALQVWWGGDGHSSPLRSTTSFVSAAYSAATCDDASLRVEGLNLLAALITVFGARPDPDAAGCFILEQSAAQIMSAMRSCLSAESPARVRAAAAHTLGSWMHSPACSGTLGAVSRCMKILQAALGACDNASACSSSTDDEASCRLALVAALARGMQADSTSTTTAGSGAVESAGAAERGVEYQELANVFDAQLLELLKLTYSSGDSKGAPSLAPPLLSAACAHAVASQSRSRAASSLAMWVAAAAAAPCAALLQCGGLQRLFAAFPTAAAPDEGVESAEGLDLDLTRAAVVCAAVIIEASFSSFTFCALPYFLLF